MPEWWSPTLSSSRLVIHHRNRECLWCILVPSLVLHRCCTVALFAFRCCFSHGYCGCCCPKILWFCSSWDLLKTCCWYFVRTDAATAAAASPAHPALHYSPSHPVVPAPAVHSALPAHWLNSLFHSSSSPPPLLLLPSPSPHVAHPAPPAFAAPCSSCVSW